MADVVVVGAGLAGCATALRLCRAGVEVTLLEGSPTVGGRVRTDLVDGLLLDHGFQVFNPSYPAARAVLDLAALDLQTFTSGVLVSLPGRMVRVGDPRRQPSWALPSLLAPVGSPLAKARVVAYALRAGYARPDRLRSAEDVSLADAFERAGVRGPILEQVLRPFLSGVLGEADLTTSRRFADFVLRSFVHGAPAVPARGVQAIPDQLVSRLPADTVQLERPVPDAAALQELRRTHRAVVVATDPVTAHRLLPGLGPAPRMNALTTYYHVAPHAPTSSRAIVVDGAARGPVVNSVVISNVAPSYAPGRVLVSSTVLSGHADAESAREVRRHLALVYDTSVRDWEQVATYVLPHALPAVPAPFELRHPVALGEGLFVTGDSRDTPSQQGALVSGRRTADAVLEALHARH